MSDRTGLRLARARRHIALAALSLLTIVTAAEPGWPQSAPPSASFTTQQPASPNLADPGAPRAAEPSAALREENPGLISEIGKLIQNPSSMLPSFKGARETIDELNTSAKGATESLTRLGGPSSMETGHTLCPVSANGGPDCKLASDQLCRAKGFKEGKSLAIDAVEKCSPKVLIPGRARKPDDCRTENFVTRAMCQ
jgi:hypothetical protein